MCGSFGRKCGFVRPLFASASTISFPMILACALTLCSAVGWVLVCNIAAICDKMILSR